MPMLPKPTASFWTPMRLCSARLSLVQTHVRSLGSLSESPSTVDTAVPEQPVQESSIIAPSSSRIIRPMDPSRIRRFDINVSGSDQLVSVNLHEKTPILSLAQHPAMAKLSGQDTNPEQYPFLNIPLRSFGSGSHVGLIELDRSVYGLPARSDILALVLEYERNWREQGTESTKSLSQVRGSTRKVFPQKGRGKARMRTRRAPQFVGGYTVHGPRPHNKATDIPRKMYDLGIRTALSTKFLQNQMIVVDHLSLDAESVENAKEIVRERLRALGIAGAKSCFFYGASALAPEPLIHAMDSFDLAKSTKEIPEGERPLLIASAKHVSVTMLFEHDYVVLDKEAVEVLEDMYRKEKL